MEKKSRKIMLSQRLSAVAEFVNEKSRVADVGCDHGFVSIFLIQNEIASHVIAMDVNEGPLARAKEHVEEYGMGDYIQLRLSDGLALLTKEDRVDTVVLAGMGGKLMEKILSEAFERNLFIQNLVLQPQSDMASFRKFLREHEYTVTDEKMICEEGKFYPVIKAGYQADRREGVDYESDLSDAFGPCLLAEKHPVLHVYLLKEIEKFDQILKQMEKNKSQDTEVREKLVFLKRAEALF